MVAIGFERIRVMVVTCHVEPQSRCWCFENPWRQRPRCQWIRWRSTGMVLWPSRAQVCMTTKHWRWKRAGRSRKVTEKWEVWASWHPAGRRKETRETLGTIIVLSVGSQNPDHSLPSTGLTKLLDCPPPSSWAAGKSKLHPLLLLIVFFSLPSVLLSAQKAIT